MTSKQHFINITDVDTRGLSMIDMPNTIKLTKGVKLQEKYLHLLEITKPTKKLTVSPYIGLKCFLKFHELSSQ